MQGGGNGKTVACYAMTSHLALLRHSPWIHPRRAVQALMIGAIKMVRAQARRRAVLAASSAPEAGSGNMMTPMRSLAAGGGASMAGGCVSGSDADSTVPFDESATGEIENSPGPMASGFHGTGLDGGRFRAPIL